MELRQLKQFVVLAETRNFHRASERLNISQPPLTVSIRKLEQELGVVLFERTSQGVTLTVAGEAALANAKRALFFADETQRSAVASASGQTGLLRLGFIGSAIYSSMPRVIRRFRTLHSSVALHLEESSMPELLHRLENALLDIAMVRVTHPIPEHPGFEMTLLEMDHMVVAMPSDSALACNASVRLEDLREESFIGFSDSVGPLMHTLWRNAFLNAGYQPRIAQEATQVQTMIGLVASGLGVALVPSSAGHFGIDGVQFVEVEGSRDFMRIGLAMVTRQDEPLVLPGAFRQVALDSVLNP